MIHVQFTGSPADKGPPAGRPRPGAIAADAWEALPRRGFIATEVSVTSQLRLLELRTEIARLVARLAALRSLPAQRAKLLELARQFMAAAKAGNELEYMKTDQAFHTLVAQCAHNELATQTLETLDSQARRFWFAHRHHAGAELPVIARLHADPLRVIRARDHLPSPQKVQLVDGHRAPGRLGHRLHRRRHRFVRRAAAPDIVLVMRQRRRQRSSGGSTPRCSHFSSASISSACTVATMKRL